MTGDNTTTQTTVPANGSASQTATSVITSNAPGSASQTSDQVATGESAQASAAADNAASADQITNETKRLQRLLTETQGKIKALESQYQEVETRAKTEADKAALLARTVRLTVVERALREAGIARPDLMAKLFEAGEKHFTDAHGLSADGKKALEEFKTSLGEELMLRRNASTPSPTGGNGAAKTQPQSTLGKLIAAENTRRGIA